MINKLLLADPVWAENYFSRVKDLHAKMGIEAASRWYGPAYSTDDLVKSMLTMGSKEAVITVRGALSPEGPTGIDEYLNEPGASYAAIQVAFIEAHDRLPAGAPIIFDLATPGGTVEGVEFTGEIISEIAKERPVILRGGYMVTSAGYWLAACCTSIEAAGKTSQFGSIGVLISGMDFTKAYESFGIVIYNLTNDASRKKAVSAATKEGQAVLIERLNAFYGVFLETVLDGRGPATSKENIESIEGAVVLADEALKLGLIDSIASTTRSNAGESGSNNDSLANAGNKTQEQKMKTLEELIAENPALSVEVQDRINKAVAKAAQETAAAAEKEAAKVKARTDAAAPYISNESYPKEIRELAADVYVGKEEKSALKACVTMFDASEEGKKLKAAADNKQESTPAINPGVTGEQKAIDKQASVIDAALGITREEA